MSYKGFSGLISLLDMLNKEKVHYNIEYMRQGAILIRACLPGIKLEIEVFENDFEFSVFRGDETVETDEDMLRKIIQG